MRPFKSLAGSFAALAAVLASCLICGPANATGGGTYAGSYRLNGPSLHGLALPDTVYSVGGSIRLNGPSLHGLALDGGVYSSGGSLRLNGPSLYDLKPTDAEAKSRQAEQDRFTHEASFNAR